MACENVTKKENITNEREVNTMTKEKIYTCSEEHCPSRLTEHEWFLYYIQYIDHDEYKTFVDWLTDMLKTGLLVEEVQTA